jgi:hypothetical protein
MKTNQIMCVRINKDLTIRIGHLTRLGKVDEVISYGNLLRELRGLKPITLHDILRTRDFWEFVIAMNTAIENDKLKKSKGENSPFGNSDNPKVQNCHFDIYSDYSQLEQYVDNKGRVKYSELIKQFPNLIRSVRGGKVENRGHYMHLNLLLKLATILDKDLEAQIYMIFIEGKILENRDNGGEAFKRLNKAIDTLPDRQPHLKPKGNKGVYINVAKMIREKLDIIDTSGYNKDEHDNIIQKKRDEYISTLVKLIEMGFVTSYPQLKETIKKL